MKITFRQVDAFRTVISSGSVTEAAEMLGISQPAVSRLISDLEAEVGFALFQREGRGLVPTEEGRLLVVEVRQAVSGMEHIKDAAAVIGTFGHAMLRLVTTPTFASQLAPDLIADFAARRPKVMTRMEIEANDDTVEWLVSQNHDFGLSTSEPANSALNSLILHRGEVSCVLPTGHPLAGKTSIQPKDLAGESYVSYVAGSRFRHAIDRLFDKQGITRSLRFETRTTDAICQLVARGLGISLVAATPAQLEAVAGCVAVPFAAALDFKAVLIWSGKRPLSAPAEEFLQLARDRVAPTA
ncbi:MAG: LysR substrate-binding domain-containing protein [Ruegeria sp.]